MREVHVRSLAKINLDLRVLNKRSDGFHELRTVFQTVSLSDRIHIEFTPGRHTNFISNLNIPDDLLIRAAESLAKIRALKGTVRFSVTKRIPLGGGLGGGSSNAAAVLLALPVLAGIHLPLETLVEVAAALGSDVPFFLLGGTAVALGRGTELYPLPDAGRWPAMVVTPDLHVSTAEAYGALNRKLTIEEPSRILGAFQGFTWRVGEGVPPRRWDSENDFETAIFHQHPQLASLRDKLLKSGARPALMSGSGSSVFGIFEDRDRRNRAVRSFRKQEGDDRIFSVSLVTARAYRSLWWRQLRPHIEGTAWPPRSRYAR